MAEAQLKKRGFRVGHTYSRTHGKSKMGKEYYAWIGMRNRCFRPEVAEYKNYGARGITVCEQWRNSFETFYSDMGPRPTEAHSLDRIDVDGNYYPSNCRWATEDEQNNNKRNSKKVVFQGKVQTISQWARHLGMSRNALDYRIKTGWTEEQIFNLPLAHNNNTRKNRDGNKT